MQLIKTDSLVYDYVKRDETANVIKTIRALDNITVAVDKGSFIAILGANGSGKSTLAKHLNAMLLPEKGSVWIEGKDTRDPSALWDIRKSVGIVFQNPDNQLVAELVEEDVSFGPENIGLPTSEILTRVEKCLDSVGLLSLRGEPVSILSGGQKQLLAIAGILAMEPECIVLDEATSMLDPMGCKEVLETIQKLRQEKNITVIMITHNTEEVLNADHVYITDHAKIVAQGTPKEIFSDAQLLKTYCLKVPPVVDLAEKLRERGFDLPADILTREELVSALCRLQ